MGDVLEFVQRRTRLNVIAITDHDDIRASYQARENAERWNYGFEAVVGMEVSTLDGHLLCLFLERPVPPGRSLEETVEAVHTQGGLCIVPHPFSWLTRSISTRGLSRLFSGESERPDGIELINPTVAGRLFRAKARRLNERRYRLSETGSSDAHFLASVGAACTAFRGSSAGDLFRCIRRGDTEARTGRGASLGSIGCRQLARQQLRSLVFMPARTACSLVGRRLRP